MKHSLQLILFTLVTTTAAVAANAHRGGVDAAGCHAGTQPYHCHNGSNETPKPATSSNECTLVKGVNAEGYETLTGPLTRAVDGVAHQQDVAKVLHNLVARQASHAHSFV